MSRGSVFIQDLSENNSSPFSSPRAYQNGLRFTRRRQLHSPCRRVPTSELDQQQRLVAVDHQRYGPPLPGPRASAHRIRQDQSDRAGSDGRVVVCGQRAHHIQHPHVKVLSPQPAPERRVHPDTAPKRGRLVGHRVLHCRRVVLELHRRLDSRQRGLQTLQVPGDVQPVLVDVCVGVDRRGPVSCGQISHQVFEHR